MAVKDRAATRVGEIAALLGRPVESFYTPGTDVLDVSMTCELLSLWSILWHPEDRQRILELLRRETGREIAAPEAAE